MSINTRSGCSLSALAIPLDAGRGLDDLIAGAFERETRDLPQVFLVLDDENALRQAAV